MYQYRGIVDMNLEVFLETDEANLILALLAEIRKPVPKNLCPTFYRTMSYEGDVALRQRANSIAEKLAG